MGSTVVVTGASRHLGAAVARRLAVTPGVDRVVGVDWIMPPCPPEDIEFVRADLAGPAFGRVLAQTRADTIVHLSLSEDAASAPASRLSQKESNVLGSLRLLAAALSARTVRRIVLKSTGSVYGSSPGDPAFFTEDSPLRPNGTTSSVRDAIEVEAYVRAAGERRADLSACVLRLTHVVGPSMRTPFMEYLTAPLVPVPLGFDARIQVLHEEDAVAALAVAATSEAAGTINVAAPGVVPLSSAVRRARRIPVPMAPLTARLWGRIPGAGTPRIGNEDRRYLYWGRCLDITRMRTVLGFEPAYRSGEALEAIRPDTGAGADALASCARRRRSGS